MSQIGKHQQLVGEINLVLKASVLEMDQTMALWQWLAADAQGWAEVQQQDAHG